MEESDLERFVSIFSNLLQLFKESKKKKNFSQSICQEDEVFL